MSEFNKEQDLRHVKRWRLVHNIFEIAFFIAAIVSLFHWDIALFTANLAMSAVCDLRKDVVSLAFLVKYGALYERD